ncbi:MAG: hypothetical protein P0116_02880 [Candidatus Nitrosocosmicus sp.]|nr:hypothetical protein [Candidatus Nitrosocosmicus sp.]
MLQKEPEVDPDNNRDLPMVETVAVYMCVIGVNANEAILDNGFADVINISRDVSEFADSN